MGSKVHRFFCFEEEATSINILCTISLHYWMLNTNL